MLVGFSFGLPSGVTVTEAGTERRQALDGEFYDLAEFQNWYPDCWQRRWQNAASGDECVDQSAGA